MDNPNDERFSITLTGALFIFLGASILSNANDITLFLVRLAGFACATVGAMVFVGRVMRAWGSDAIPFAELAGAGILLLIGVTLLMFAEMFVETLFFVLGLLLVLSGLGDIARSHAMGPDQEREEKIALRVGIALVAIGAFVAMMPAAAVHIVPYVCGVALVLDGLAELFVALEMPYVDEADR